MIKEQLISIYKVLHRMRRRNRNNKHMFVVSVTCLHPAEDSINVSYQLWAHGIIKEQLISIYKVLHRMRRRNRNNKHMFVVSVTCLHPAEDSINVSYQLWAHGIIKEQLISIYKVLHRMRRRNRNNKHMFVVSVTCLHPAEDFINVFCQLRAHGKIKEKLISTKQLY